MSPNRCHHVSRLYWQADVTISGWASYSARSAEFKKGGHVIDAQRLPVWAALFLVLSLIGLGGIAAVYERQRELVRHTYEVEGATNATLSAAQDVELALRGYALTGWEPYRLRLTRDRDRFYREVDRLWRLVQDNPEQQRSVALMRRLGDEHFARNAAWFAGEPARRQNIEVVSLDPIREIAAQLRARETTLLRARTEAAERWRIITLVGVVLALCVAAGMLFLWLRDRRLRAEALHEKERETAARRAAEGQLTQLQKMEALGRLTGGVAHDFNNMLAVIISAISLVQRRLAAGNTDVQALLDSARDGATRAASLTARLLAFSRQQPLAPRTLNASRMVANMQDLLRRSLGEHVQLETVLGGGLWLTFADPSQLENAILNLAINARDAMPNGGRLTIETANVALDDAYARQHQEVAAGQYVMIAVSDTGSGMTQEVIDRAFEPFFTTKGPGEGTGLGLSQVHGFIKQSGGHISIYSELGQGTTVKLYLPRYLGEETEAPRTEYEAKVPAGDVAEVILVVEDEDRLREIAVAALKEAGYTAIPAKSGAEALRLLDQHPEICCLFTDIVMPEMSGRELADAATSRRPDLKVLYTTGYTRNAIIHGGTLDPGVNFLAKPFSADDLARKVREVLGPLKRAMPQT